MKKVLVIILIALSISIYIQAAENRKESTDEKIDSIYVWQKEMYRTHKDEPLKGKKYGVEFNFLRLIFFGTGMEGINHTLSGGFSIFYPEKNIELAFPLLYSNPDKIFVGEIFGRESHRQKFTVDCQYRKFLGNTLNKFYLNALVRYAYTKHTIENYESSTNHAFGIGVGIGYRIFSYSGFYWGTNLSFGKYISGSVKTSTIFGPTAESEFLFNFSLFKFGYAF